MKEGQDDGPWGPRVTEDTPWARRGALCDWLVEACRGLGPPIDSAVAPGLARAADRLTVALLGESLADLDEFAGVDDGAEVTDIPGYSLEREEADAAALTLLVTSRINLAEGAALDLLRDDLQRVDV